MKIKFLPLFLTLIAALGMIAGCNSGPSEEELALAAAQEQFVTVKDANAQLQQMRSDLEATQATITEIEAVAERQRTDEQKAQLEEATASVETLNKSIEETYGGLQEHLADFLTVALNEFPAAPETAEALEIYSLEAISVTNDIVEKSGDYFLGKDQE